LIKQQQYLFNHYHSRLKFEEKTGKFSNNLFILNSHPSILGHSDQEQFRIKENLSDARPSRQEKVVTESVPPAQAQ